MMPNMFLSIVYSKTFFIHLYNLMQIGINVLILKTLGLEVVKYLIHTINQISVTYNEPLTVSTGFKRL